MQHLPRHCNIQGEDDVTMKESTV